MIGDHEHHLPALSENYWKKFCESKHIAYAAQSEASTLSPDGLADLDTRVRGPRSAREFPRRADKMANYVSAIDRTRRALATYVTGSPGDPDAFWPAAANIKHQDSSPNKPAGPEMKVG